MNIDALLPFGQRESDGVFVDVEDVDNGLACGCVCPSCKVKLSAKQGECNAWHFAHAPRDNGKKLVEACELS